MESTAFIKDAAAVTSKIKDIEVTSGISDVEVEIRAREAVQKELNKLFSSLSNPTLPSAYKLRDLAIDFGYTIDPRVEHRLAVGESMWP